MTFTSEELDLLQNGQIYLEECGTLAQRVDFAWAVYVNKDEYDDYKEGALKFLIYAFDLSDSDDINQQLLILMSERQHYLDVNPEYIPNKKPQYLALDPTQLNLRMMTSEVPQPIVQAIQSKELLDLKDVHKWA